MSGVALAIGGGAVVGAIGSAYSAKQANKPRNSTTDQYTTQTPYLSGWTEGDIGRILDYQRGLVSQGVPQVGPNGQIYYAPMPHSPVPSLSGGGANYAPVGNAPVATSSQQAPKQAPKSKQDLWSQYLASGGNKNDTAAWQAFQKKGGGGTSGVGKIAPSKPLTPEQIFEQVAQRGFAEANHPLVGKGQTAIGNILGAAGGGGPEVTGYEGFNPILDQLTRQHQGDVQRRYAEELLMGFIGGGQVPGPSGGIPYLGQQGAQSQARDPFAYMAPAGAGASQPQTTPSGHRVATGGSFGAGYATAGAPTPQVAGVQPPGYPAGSYPGAYPGGSGVGPPQGPPWGQNIVPDASGAGVFGQQSQKVFDEQANQAEMEDLISRLNADVEKGMFRDLASLDASAQGAGRMGGDAWAAMGNMAREETAQEMLEAAAGIRVGDREARRQARMQALGLVGQRDLGALEAQVNREQIAAQERIAAANASAAGAGAGAAAAAMQGQLDLERRAQDLRAIGMIMEGEQFGLGQLGDIGGQLSQARLSGIGMIPDIQGIGQSGLQLSLGGGGGLADLRQMDINRRIAGGAQGLQRAGMDQQLAMFNIGQQQGMVNDYLRTIGGVGSMGGSSHTWGKNVQPGAGISPTGAAFTGALGGAATGMGLYDLYRGMGSGGAAATGGAPSYGPYGYGAGR